MIPPCIRLAPEDLTVVDGLAVTTLGRTYLDLGAIRPAHLRRAFVRAEQQFQFDLFELAYLLAITKAELPIAQVNNRVGDFEVDFHWPEVTLVVEIDGPHHDTAFRGRRAA